MNTLKLGDKTRSVPLNARHPDPAVIDVTPWRGVGDMNCWVEDQCRYVAFSKESGTEFHIFDVFAGGPHLAIEIGPYYPIKRLMADLGRHPWLFSYLMRCEPFNHNIAMNLAIDDAIERELQKWKIANDWTLVDGGPEA